MNRLLLSLFLLLITFSWSFGQEPFRVIFSAGNNYEKNERGFFELKNGTGLHPEDEIVVMPNGIVILMDQQGRMLALGLEGTYIISGLDLSQLSSPSELIYQEWESYYHPKRQILEPLYAPENNFVALQLDFPSSTAVYGRYIDLTWPDLMEEYQIELTNEFDEVIETFDTQLNQFRLDLLNKTLAFRDAFGVRIQTKGGNRSTGITFLDKMAPPKAEEFSQLLRIFPEENDLIIGLTKAIIYNNRGLYADASTLLRNLNKSYNGQVVGFYETYLRMNGF